MRRNLRVNRLFVKMLLYFSSLLIPIIIIGSVTYGNYVTKFKNNFAEKMTLNLQFSSNTVDVYLRTLQEAGINFFHTVTVKEMLRPFSQYTLEERAKLNDIVISVKNTSNIVVELATNVFMFIDDKKVYTNQGVEEFDLFFNQLLVYDKYDENYWKDIDNRHPNQLFEFLPPAYQSDTQSWIKVVPLLVSSLIRGHQTHLVLNISVDMLQKTLEGNAAYKTTQFILMDSNQNIIVTTGPNPLEDSEIARLQAAFSDGTMSNQELELHSGSYMASYVRSEVYGWEFYSLTPLSEFYIEAKGILGMIVVMCAILIIIGFVFSFIFAYKLYNPIKNIRDILLNKSEPSNEVSSSGNELEWISKGITQLIHYNQSFERQLDHVSREYIDHAFLHLLKDRTIPNEQVFQKTLEKKLQFSKTDYVCCTIRMQLSDHFYEDIEESERLVIIGKLKNVIWGIFSDYVNLHILEYTQHFYVCIINVKDNEDDAILVNQAVTRFLQTFEYDSLYCIIHIGKGNVHTGLEGAAESYHESILALQYRKTEEKSEITHYEQLEIRHSIYFTFADELKILNGLKAGDVDVATIVDEMLTLYKQSQTGGAMIGTLITDIYRTGLRFLLEMDFDLYTFITEEQHRLLMETNEFLMDETVEKRVLLDFFERLSSAVSNRLKIVQKSDTHVSAIVAFITEKYEQELYLENISEQMGLSPKYVSRIFKEKTKMNISDYINMVRINKAKVLLSETDLAIYEISELVGITSRTTFLRVFKKTTGMSPREYRKKNNVQFKEGGSRL